MLWRTGDSDAVAVTGDNGAVRTGDSDAVAVTGDNGAVRDWRQ